MKTILQFLFFAFFIALLCNCARTGRPEGGPKDEEAPLFVTSNPPYESTKFKEEQIKLEFNEFIKLKDLNKQLVVSPPLKNPLLITPQGAATKKLTLKILDTLKENTTYIINFGNAIEDNNEGNPLEAFKYVFSTGDYIDSLTTKGIVKDAFFNKKLKSVNVLMYRIDSTYNDSIIYNRKPDYVTNTLDSTEFNFSNLRKGKYFMIALKESTSDYLFSPKTDIIGFYADTITLPKDSIIKKTITIFKEILPYRFRRAKEINKGKIIFGYEGKEKDFKVKLTSNVPENFKSVSKFETDKDTLNYWFTPHKIDSLNFLVYNDNYIDTVTVKLRKKKIDSLTIQSSSKGILHLRDTFFITTNNPIVKIDTSKISITDKDTIPVSFREINSIKENKIAIVFDKKPEQKYTMRILPNAFVDIYQLKNDTLSYNLFTKEIEDYGRITVNIVNESKENVIIDLVSGKDKDELIERTIVKTTSKNLVFDLLEPKTYYIRAIIDTNKNGKWDTGNYLLKKQPESILYFENELKIRANYYLEENTFIIKK